MEAREDCKGISQEGEDEYILKKWRERRAWLPIPYQEVIYNLAQFSQWVSPIILTTHKGRLQAEHYGQCKTNSKVFLGVFFFRYFVNYFSHIALFEHFFSHSLFVYSSIMASKYTILWILFMCVVILFPFLKIGFVFA